MPNLSEQPGNQVGNARSDEEQPTKAWDRQGISRISCELIKEVSELSLDDAKDRCEDA